jgi:biopolymer transport protein ExbB
MAMICTMTGLAVSISGLYPVHYFRTRARHETELLADRLPL